MDPYGERSNGLRDLFLLRPGVTFFNHGSYGACPRPVFDAYQAWQLEMERQPVEFVQRRARDLLCEARQALGEFVGAAAGDLVYVVNATMGLNIVARSVPLEPGDEVLTTDHEYGSLNRTWEFVCEKRGARYIHRSVPLPIADAEQVVDAIWSGVTDRTRVLFISHITSPTALIFPVAQLVRRAREAGIISIVDGAHASGQVPLDQVLGRLDTGIYVSNLWYLNYSDRNACRATGMTRFATFWVEHGVVQSPLNVMRFDETMYRVLGENLAGLTVERDLILDTDTYFRRSTNSGRMPGALIEDFTFTL